MSRVTSFIETYPNAEIIGGPILAIQHALGAVANPYFERAGLVNIQPDRWYSMTKYLQVIFDITEHEPNVMENLVAMGMRTVDHAKLPPEIDTLEKGLMAMQQGWKMNSRNGRDVIWTIKKVDDNTFICSSSSPFPAEQEYGILYGFVRKFSHGQRFTVSYEDLAELDNREKEEVRYIVKLG